MCWILIFVIGQSYAAGDVLLEIETDKAQMDVEAQDDGVLFKIMQSDGSKAVKVGARIAVIAEPGDDLSALSIPEEESSSTSQSSKKEESAPKEQSTDPRAEPEQKASTDGGAKSSPESQPSHSGLPNQKYPLYPSVQSLLKVHGLSKDEAAKIPATGPNGRLLKGDVLSYIGQISKDYPSQESARVKKLSHLDLSNIQLSSPKPSGDKKSTAPPALEQDPDTEIAVPISLAAVIATQKRVVDTLGIKLPLSVFIGRASELANEELPLSSRKTPSADELFDAVLGLDKVHSSAARLSRGNYYPSVAVMPPAQPVAPRSASRRSEDVFDELIGAQSRPKTVRAPPLPALVPVEGVAAAVNVFSVTARSGEEKRVRAYLDRMKLVLEGEPGRLVL